MPPSHESGAAVFTAPSGAWVTLPTFGAAHVETLRGQNRNLLLDVPLQDVVSFLNRVGRNWKSPEYARRRLYVLQLQELLGYSQKAAEAEADRIGILLTAHARVYDVVAADLGSRDVLDQWVPREESWVRAYPRGLTVHLLPGNVPLSSVISVVRALVTKNLCVAKSASTDPATPSALALSFMDVDPEHPVARALSVVYWQHENEAAEELLSVADAVCAWGGADAIAWAHRHTREQVPFIPFGPKRSMALVAHDADLAAAARGLAHDVTVYDQHACFSTQRVFVEGDAEPLIRALQEQLDAHEQLLPAAERTEDDAARVQLARLEEIFFGARVLQGDTWMLVVLPAAESAGDHPLGRTLYVHPVKSLEEAYSYASDEVQTVSAAPWSALDRHRDELARRGVSRFVEVGMSNIFRVGGTHDSQNPLQGLVRMVATEAPARVHGKGMVVPINQTELLRAGSLKDLVL